MLYVIIGCSLSINLNVPVIVINRPQDHTRRQFMEQQFNNSNFTNFTYVVHPPRLPFRTNYPISRNEIGCTRAHVSALISQARAASCFLIVEDDADLSLMWMWPLSLHEICEKMTQHDPLWNTLQLYASGTRKPARGTLTVSKFKEGTWGTVAYLATPLTGKSLLHYTVNNTLLLKHNIRSKWGTADSVVYNYLNSHGYTLSPSYIYLNINANSIIHPSKTAKTVAIIHRIKQHAQTTMVQPIQFIN